MRRLVLAVVCALLVGGCAALPDKGEQAVSSAIPAAATTALGQVAAASTPPPPHSAFRLIHSGTQALDARLALISAASVSIDAQYYHVAGDATGRRFLRALRDAAARGVRVRLLVDDLHTTGLDELFAGLGAHQNVEVRLFNPFASRAKELAARFTASLLDFGRLQRRMHNKLLVADGAFAITGGRNITDEYYWQSEASAFFDLDVLLAGPVVADMAAQFDLFWNSEQAWPVQALHPVFSSPDALRRRFDAEVSITRPLPPPLATDLLGQGRLADELRAGRVVMHAGPAIALADPPGKVTMAAAPQDTADPWAAQTDMRRTLNGILRQAQEEVVLVSPYAVPGSVGIERLYANRERGVRVRILTNSMASTDEIVVHTGYRRYRERMLQAGVELYELDPKPSAQWMLAEKRGDPVLRVHTKAAIVDRRAVFIGSMNLDPRSTILNTEIGVVLDSEAFARDVLRLVELVMERGAWRVRLDLDGSLVWSNGDQPPTVLHQEPRTTAAQRWWLELLSVVVPESVL